ncbi:MAG: DUF4395 domain-containing protein [Nocardioides sp.]|uniref:DUF4395 domain-containing protein n=1 Tax=Nocardioides sp. TaxID=35761 RepID=UPI003265D59C
MIDPRGPRFTAAVTLVLLAVALLVPTPVAVTLVAVQALFFLSGVTLGVQQTPTAYVFKTFVRPRLSPPAGLEDARPPRFAQGIGLVFTAVALLAFAGGAVLVAQVAIGFAVVAALLNAVFGLCLGCELYLFGLRLRTS